MYRVYDIKEEKWVKENIYLSPNNDLFTSKKALFGTEKLSLASGYRYVYHVDIGLVDSKNSLIFVGDICKIEHLDVIGVITYIPEHATFYLLDDKNLKYYPLSEDRCKQLEIIGNVFENRDLLPKTMEIKYEDTEW